MSTTPKASDLVAELKTADAERAQAILDAERADPAVEPRKTVVEAAEARLAELEPLTQSGGEVLDAEPQGAWAQLIDGDTGEPVLVDGQPVATELVD